MTAVQVQEKINSLVKDINSKFLELGKYFKVLNENKLYKELGYKTYRDWFLAQRFDFGIRKSQYLSSFYEMQRALNINEEKLKKVGISKLREIVNLDVDKNKKDIFKLLNSPKLSLLEVRNEVEKLTGNHRQYFFTVGMPDYQSVTKLRSFLKKESGKRDCSIGAALLKELQIK